MKKVGDWEVFPAYLRAYSRNLAYVDKIFLIKAAEMFLNRIKDDITTQRFAGRYPPLTSKWVSTKILMGWDVRMWIATGEFLNNLRIKGVGKGKVFVGATRMRHKGSGLRMCDLCEIFEYGTMKATAGGTYTAGAIPPRPIIRPAREFMSKKWPSMVTGLGIMLDMKAMKMARRHKAAGAARKAGLAMGW